MGVEPMCSVPSRFSQECRVRLNSGLPAIIISDNSKNRYPYKPFTPTGSPSRSDPLSPTLYAIFENELLEELHSGRTMQDSLHVCLFALVYADDLVGIATSPTALQDQIITPCYQYSRRYRYRANVPKSGVMICGPVHSTMPAPKFMWGEQEIPLV